MFPIVRRILLATCVVASFAIRANGAFAPLVDALQTNAHTTPNSRVPNDGAPRVAIWPFSLFGGGSQPIYDSLPGDAKPHPAVVRVIAPEDGATAYGSGTLVGVRDQHGLVVTNWHVVRDATGLVEVVFPDGFRSHAKPLKVDQDWDLAALVIWRPNVEPVRIAAQPPRPGDILTIHGYGQGKYRVASGRCTNYYSPQPNYPHEMVELDVEARQGDSGGPIFNQSGELAGVLFGAGQGTTMGSFAPRVRVFLAQVAPDLEQANALAQLAAADRPAPVVNIEPPPTLTMPPVTPAVETQPEYPSSPWSPPIAMKNSGAAPGITPASNSNNFQSAAANETKNGSPHEPLSLSDLKNAGWYDPAKSALAVIGLAAIALRLVKLIH